MFDPCSFPIHQQKRTAERPPLRHCGDNQRLGRSFVRSSSIRPAQRDPQLRWKPPNAAPSSAKLLGDSWNPGNTGDNRSFRKVSSGHRIQIIKAALVAMRRAQPETALPGPIERERRIAKNVSSVRSFAVAGSRTDGTIPPVDLALMCAKETAASKASRSPG